MRHIEEIFENLSTNLSLNYDNNNTDIVLFENNNNTNLMNASSFILSSNKHGFIFNLNLNFIILLALALVFVIFLMTIGVWFGCKRVNRLHRGHSVPLSENDFIEPIKIPVKHLSPSPIKKSSIPPPVPPRPTAYTTILEKLEYRSNL